MGNKVYQESILDSIVELSSSGELVNRKVLVHMSEEFYEGFKSELENFYQSVIDRESFDSDIDISVFRAMGYTIYIKVYPDMKEEFKVYSIGYAGEDN